MIPYAKKLIDVKNYGKNAGIIFRVFVAGLKKVFFIDSIKVRGENARQLFFYEKYIGRGKLIFDIGANIGKKTDLFLELDSRVVAVEPQSGLASLLKNRYRDKPVVIEQCGIGEKEGRAEIRISTRYPGFSSFKTDWQAGTKYDSFDKKETVSVTTLDFLIDKHGLPDFCKIDVEGYEPFVLAGLSRKIPLLNFEFHSNHISSLKQCIDRLADIGYTFANLVFSESAEMALKQWVPLEEITKIISETPSDRILWGDIYVR